MEELIMELRILKETMTNSKNLLKKRLDEDENYNKDTSFLEADVCFGNVLYTITKNLSKEQLMNMSDKDMLAHINKLEIIEKD